MRNNLVSVFIERGIFMLSLSQAPIGTVETIKWNLGYTNCVSSLTEGNIIEVIASYFGNVIVKSNGKRFAIDKDAANKIKL